MYKYINLQESKITKRWLKLKATMLQSGWYSLIRYFWLVFLRFIFIPFQFPHYQLHAEDISNVICLPNHPFQSHQKDITLLKGLPSQKPPPPSWPLNILKNHRCLLIQACWLEQRQQVHEKSGKSTKIEKIIKKISRRCFWRSWERTKWVLCWVQTWNFFTGRQTLEIKFNFKFRI